MSRPCRVLPALLATLLLTGCLGVESPMRLAGWFDPPAAQSAPADAPPTPYYCYRNLARTDCYTSPDPYRHRD